MLPEKFTERMQKMLGEEYTAFLHSFEQDKYQALRVNPLKSRAGQRLESAHRTHGELLGKYFNLTPVSWEKSGFYYTKEDQPGKHPLHEAGVYYIQEPSAMAVVPLLEIQPGERVLDLCAAPGGKSTQIAGYLQGRGLLVANEIHPARAKILSETIERLGVYNACVTNEEPTKLSEKFARYFDKILVDAPCSGEGMFRKNEAAGEEWSPENVALCADRQDGILDCAAKMLRPGGRIVYSTCTFAPAENEGSVSRFLQRHPEFSLVPINKEALGLPPEKCDGRPEWCAAQQNDWADSAAVKGALRLWPHLVRGEGHFAAVLQNQETSAAGSAAGGEITYEPVAAGGMEKGIPPKDKSLEPWWSFWRETAAGTTVETEAQTAAETAARMTAERAAETAKAAEQSESGLEYQLQHGLFLRFGDNLYLAPEKLPSLKGMKVLRPGLQLGTIKKDRFEPSHALALAVSPDEIRHICQINLADEEQKKLASMYLNGQTFPLDGEKGWYLVTIDGYGLGWGKLAGGILKNHYPKGLRKNG